jgi:hypothetical protein
VAISPDRVRRDATTRTKLPKLRFPHLIFGNRDDTIIWSTLQWCAAVKRSKSLLGRMRTGDES